MFKTGLINTVLRGLTLGSKFLLLLVLARTMTPAELGIYGLMVVTITVSLYLLGFDFHAYNTREILATNRNEWSVRMRDQIIFHFCIYVLVLPLLLVIFLTDTLDWSYAVWFYPLLILEHLSQESYRFLITLSRSSMANTVLFLRSGIWVFAVAGAGLFAPDTVTLSLVFGAWAVGVTLSLVLAAVAMRDLEWRRSFSAPVNWSWIRQGVRVSLRFFGATICLLGVQYADRYFLKHFHGEEAVGVYTFYWQITNVVQVFVYTAVATVLYPRLVESYQNGRIAAYRRHMKRLVFGIAGTIVVVSVGIAAIIRPVLGLVGHDIYREHLTVGWILLAAMVLLSFSYIPHLALYVRRLDRAILWASVVTLVVALIGHILLVPRFGPMGAAWGTLGAAGVLLGSKLIVAGRYRGIKGPVDDSDKPGSASAKSPTLTIRRGVEEEEMIHA